MPSLREAATQALEALEGGGDSWQRVGPAIDALRTALAEPQCNPHPKAPHGFLRNASHTEGRYVCECEYWDGEPVQAAVLEEREACAKVCDEMEKRAEGTECCKWPTPSDCAAAIRGRHD